MAGALPRLASRLKTASAALLLCALARAATAHNLLAPPITTDTTLSAAWQLRGQPGSQVPVTQFQVTRSAGEPAIRIVADATYGLLVHALSEDDIGLTLAWQWAIVRANPAADLRTKAGDDSPLKVCAMFDLPLHALPLGDRLRLRIARWRTRQALPAATLCYVWDPAFRTGEILPNPYSGRVRYMVLQTDAPVADDWRAERRDLAADLARAFGKEADAHPRLVGIAFGGDADNTGRASEALLRGIVLERVSRVGRAAIAADPARTSVP